MLQADTKIDPIVEILRLAYRRGIALRQEEEEKNKSVNLQALQGKSLLVGLKQSASGIGASEGWTKISK